MSAVCQFLLGAYDSSIDLFQKTIIEYEKIDDPKGVWNNTIKTAGLFVASTALMAAGGVIALPLALLGLLGYGYSAIRIFWDMVGADSVQKYALSLREQAATNKQEVQKMMAFVQSLKA